MTQSSRQPTRKALLHPILQMSKPTRDTSIKCDGGFFSSHRGPGAGHTLSPRPELEQGAADHPVTFSDRHKAQQPGPWMEGSSKPCLMASQRHEGLENRVADGSRAPANPTVPQAWPLGREVGPPRLPSRSLGGSFVPSTRPGPEDAGLWRTREGTHHYEAGAGVTLPQAQRRGL